MKKSLNILIGGVLVLGVVSLAYAQEGGPGGDRPERPEFSSVDVDGSGDVDFEEFSQQRLPGGDYQTIFDNIDTDGDGLITEQEFKDHKPPAPPRR